MTGTGSDVHRRKVTCRACGSGALRPFLSLGPTPLANAFLGSPQEFAGERSYPLDVYFCEACSLVQLVDVIDPRVLFGEYLYVSGASTTMAEHYREYARTVVERMGLIAGDLVVEVASNDGSLLKCFSPYGVRTLGIEPASNVAEIAGSEGVETLNRFFDAAAARDVRRAFGPAKVVVANNVLAHVDDTIGFLEGCRLLIEPGGLIAIEVPYVGDLIDRLEYDTIYHEHLCYFSMSALLRCCKGAGISVVALDHVPVHGGSLRVYAGSRERHAAHAPEVLARAAAEARAGLSSLSRYQRFAADVEKSRAALPALLRALRREGKTIAGYGAPAKGNTLLNCCGIGSDVMAFTVDKNPLKVGRYTPGTHIPVLPVSALGERQPDYVVILPWNLAAEIMEQEREYHERGGRFIIPIPEPRIV